MSVKVKAKCIKDLPLKNEFDGSESLIVQDSNGTKQAPLEVIVEEIKQNSQEKIREIESELDQTNAQLSQKVYYFDSIEHMKKANLKVGDMVITKGYYSPNDGGGAKYEIVSAGVVDNGYIHQLNNSLYANMMIEDRKCNVRQFGAKGDGIADDTQAILNAKDCKAVYEVLFTVGDYKFTQPLLLNGFKKFVGSSFNNLWDNYKESTTRLLYYPQANDTIAITLDGANVIFSDLVIVNQDWTKHSTGLKVRSSKSHVSRIKIYDFDYIGFILGGMYSQYNDIEVTATNEFIAWVNEDRENRLCYALCKCDDWGTVESGYKTTDATVQNLALGAPTYGIHEYGIIIKGINNVFTDLTVPTPAKIPVLFGDDENGAVNCEINHIYMEENYYSGFDYNFIFNPYTRGCSVTNGYLSGKLKVKDDGLKNSYNINTAMNLLSLYDNFSNSKNYANFYFKEDEGVIKITDGIYSDGEIYSDLFYMLGVDAAGNKRLLGKNVISIDVNAKFNIGARIKNTYQSRKLFEGKTICFGCKYSLSKDADINEKNLMPRDRMFGNRGIGMNGIAQCHMKIPEDFFKDNDYYWFQFVDLTQENIGTTGNVELSDFFFYVVEENVSPFNNNLQSDGDALHGELLVKNNIILSSPNGDLFRLIVSDDGILSSRKCYHIKTKSGIGYSIEPLTGYIIDDGNPFRFNVIIHEGYDATNLSVPGATLDADGTYYRNITSNNITIYATGVVKASE